MKLSQTSILAMVLLGVIADGHAFTIAHHGEPRSVVYVAPNAKKAAMLAARELREYVEKVSGAELDIVHSLPAKRPVIYVGDGEHVRRMGISVAGLPIEGYHIISDKDR